MPTQPEGPRIGEYMRELVQQYRVISASVDPIRAKKVEMWTAQDRAAMRDAVTHRETVAVILTGAVGAAIDSYDAEQAKQSVA